MSSALLPALLGRTTILEAVFIFDKILQPIVTFTIGKTAYADMKKMEVLLMKSDLDWTVVRSSGLFDTDIISSYRVEEDHKRAVFPSRADLVACMLKLLTTNVYSRNVVAVATFSGQPVYWFMLKETSSKKA